MFFPRATTACFVDVWVFCHLLLAFITIVLVALVGQTWYTMILVIYGLMRVFEVSVYQMNMPFDEYRARKAEKEYAVEGIDVLFYCCCTTTLKSYSGLRLRTSSLETCFLSEWMEVATRYSEGYIRASSK